MKQARHHLIPALLEGLLVLVSIVAGATLVARPVAAASLPVTFAGVVGCQDPSGATGTEDAINGTVCCPPGTVPLSDGYSCCPTGFANNANSCLFAKYINPLIQLLSALVGLAVVISIIFGGIQYVTSAGDPQRAEAGKKRIIESLVGLAAFMLLYAFLQYITPGGVLNAH